ncbi:MAG: aminotransferase class V-fold PLP-dependent enzyme [Rhodococcus sp. (in: high G+C Gram-positive bacteria)]
MTERDALSADELALVRADTPAADTGVFLDSAGSSLPPRQVVDTVVGHLRREAEIGGYRAARERADDVAAVRHSVGRLIGAPAETIALSDSATRAWCDFFYSIPLERGDRILISSVEYATNAIAALQRARATGAVVETIPIDAAGTIDLDALATMMDDRVAVVSLVHAPTNGGLLNPVREISDMAHRHGALVLLDACQSLGQVALDVEELGVDAVSATGRKWLRGPRGTGFLHVAESVIKTIEPRSLDLYSASWTGPDTFSIADDATRFETWEHDVAARLGLGAAVDYLLDLGAATVEAAVRFRAERLRSALSETTGIVVHDLGDTRTGIVTFTIEGMEAAAVKDALAARDVTVTVSSASSTLLDMTRRGLDSIVRASPHYFLTTDQIDRAAADCRALAEAIRQ